ncbi:hypothetical protein ANN_27436 [Periplaneta americana]|uniref:RNase H type-1 domain-containing protein n=1 Tax=Periplaneta americana TaxID=6978 RepID=A0ABQ8RVZ1_PERAM|nr:hypothetical protein ANN_27436 [Periplaneta americana]
MIEEIRRTTKAIEMQNWKIDFKCIKAHVGHQGNELADHLKCNFVEQEGNIMDLQVKTECVDHSYDLNSEIKVEESPVPINFPVLKSEVEESPVSIKSEVDENSFDLDMVQEKQEVEACSEEDEVLNEGIVENVEKTVSSEQDEIIHDEQNLTRSDNYRLDRSISGNISHHSVKCKICNSGEVTEHSHIHKGENAYKCNVCEKSTSPTEGLTQNEDIDTSEGLFKCDKLTITRIRDKFEVDGTVQDVLKGRCGRKRSSADNERVDVVMQAFAESAKKSIRQCSLEIGTSKSSVHIILRAQKWKPYILRLIHALNEYDPEMNRIKKNFVDNVKKTESSECGGIPRDEEKVTQSGSYSLVGSVIGDINHDDVKFLGSHSKEFWVRAPTHYMPSDGSFANELTLLNDPLLRASNELARSLRAGRSRGTFSSLSSRLSNNSQLVSRLPLSNNQWHSMHDHVTSAVPLRKTEKVSPRHTPVADGYENSDDDAEDNVKIVDEVCDSVNDPE